MVPEYDHNGADHLIAHIYKVNSYIATGGRESSAGIATRYRLDGPGIEYRWGAKFSVPAQTGPGAHPVQWVPGLSRG